MIITVTDYRNINTRMIMDIYSESNSENADIFFPDETDRDTALRKAEDGFLDYLKNDFFRQPGALHGSLHRRAHGANGELENFRAVHVNAVLFLALDQRAPPVAGRNPQQARAAAVAPEIKAQDAEALFHRPVNGGACAVPKQHAVFRSFQSKNFESTSTPMTNTRRYVPVLMNCAATVEL